MQTSQVSIELSERIETKTKSIHDNKDSFEYWKNSLIKLGYERSKTSFLEECDLGEEKYKKVVQSVRLRRAATAGIKKNQKGAVSADSLLFQFFDLTSNRQRELFNHWDRDNDGSIGINEFLAGLKSQNLNIENDTSTRTIIAELFNRKPEELEITLHEFATFLHRTKLAILFYEPLRRQVYLKIKGHGLFLSDALNRSKPAEYVPTAELLIVDYNKSDVNIGCANPNSVEPPIAFTLKNNEAKKYFFGSRKKEWTMRWLTVMKPDPISIITLAVKYRLHPLALEDMLQLNLQRPKVDKYDAHYFVVLPAFRLTDAAFDMMSKWNIKDPDLCDLWDSQKDDTPGGTVLVEKQNYCLCVAGPNRLASEFSYDTVISVEAGYSPMIPITSQGKTPHQSVQSKKHLGRTCSGTMDIGRGTLSRGYIASDRQQTYDGGTHLPTADKHGAFQRDLFRLLGTDFSRLRMQRSVFMMYQLIDCAVEKIAPVLDMYQQRLDWYTYQIRKQRWKFGDRIRGLLDTKRELELVEEILRPCVGVIRHIINDEDIAPEDNDPLVKRNDSGSSSSVDNVPARMFKKSEIKQYFEDIDDTLQLYLEKLKHMAELCESYNQEFASYGDKRMNDILFVLTIVTTLFVPAQFFTGVFGMNFVKPDGTPNAPLLTWEYGYFFFWCLSLGLTFLTFLILFMNGWMPCQACNKCADHFDEDEV